MPVWGAVVRKIGFRHAPVVEYSFVLLRTLLAYELVDAKAALSALDDVWRVVAEEPRFVTLAALELVSILIAKVLLLARRPHSHVGRSTSRHGCARSSSRGFCRLLLQIRPPVPCDRSPPRPRPPYPWSFPLRSSPS